MPLLDELKAHRDEILASAERNGVINVRVFGSVARREDGPDSDIDLLIDIKKPIKDAFGFLYFQEDVSELFHRKVDIVFESGLFHAMRDQVIQDAKNIEML